MNKALMGLVATLFLQGCSSGINGTQYKHLEPKFVLEDYFNGPVKVWGIVQDRSGNVTSRFDADIIGSWQGSNGILDETFHYYEKDSKQAKKRVWKIQKVNQDEYIGEAGDIVGKAKGKSYGNALRWTYEMKVPTQTKTYLLTFDDWIWAMNGDVIVNRSYLKKFGFTVAEVTIFMQKSKA